MAVFDWIRSHASHAPDKVALIDWHTKQQLTYADMHHRVARIAGYLQDSLDINKGDRVALLSMNGSHVFELQFACARLGAIFSPLNIRLAKAELDYILKDLNPGLIILDSEFETLGTVLAEECGIEHTVLMTGNIDSCQLEQGLAVASPVYEMTRLQDEDIWIILYTSGTTGSPKGVCLHHGMIFENAIASSGLLRLTRDSTNLCFLPHFHTGGLNIFANPCFFWGGTNVIMQSFEPASVLQILNDQNIAVSHFIGVPSTFQMMAVEPAFGETNFDSIVSPMIGGAPASPALLKKCVDVGLNLIHGYGLTEAGPVVITQTARIAARTIGSSGKPPYNIRVRLVGKDGKDVKQGDIGEIWIRGPAVTLGYWRNPDITADTIRNGWLKTGDAARVDENGYYYIADRWKDMYISGGENVYPAEVEKAIYELDDVHEVAVVARPHEKWGETGIAYVVLREDNLTGDDIIVFCKQRLARYKVPEEVVLMESLPHNATGKILKYQLKANNKEM